MTEIENPAESLRGRRVAVTGAAGFIGSTLTRELDGLGCEVVGIDCLLSAPCRSRVRETVWNAVNSLGNVDGYLLDLRSDPLEAVLEGVEVVFHLAAVTGLGRTDPDIYKSCNVEASERLGRYCAEMGVSRFIHASTSSVYGAIAVGDETSALQPVSEYGRTKLKAEEILGELSKEADLNVTILRLFSVYGPGQRPDMAYHRIIEAALSGRRFEVFGDGEQVRSNTFVDDIVEGLIRSTAGSAIGETMNLAGGKTVSLNLAIETVEKLTGRPVERTERPARSDDQRHTEGDWSKARDLIGFAPRTSFTEGMRRQIEAQQNSGKGGAGRAPCRTLDFPDS